MQLSPAKLQGQRRKWRYQNSGAGTTRQKLEPQHNCLVRAGVQEDRRNHREGEREKHGFSILLSLPSLLSTSRWVNLAGSQLIWEPRKCNLKTISPLKHPAEQKNMRDAADEKQAQNPMLLPFLPPLCPHCQHPHQTIEQIGCKF